MRKPLKKEAAQIHCGACMENFNSIKDLKEHLDNCPAGIVMLPIIYDIWFIGERMGHPLSHFIYNLYRNACLIKRYAYAIADDTNTFSRSQLHSELCEKLSLDYNEFRPFESSEIKKIPTRQEAECILWEAFRMQAIKEVEHLKRVGSM